MAARIHVVGVGLDGAAGFAPAVLERLGEAVFWVGSDRHLSYFPEHSTRRFVLGDLAEAIAQLQAFIQEQPDQTAAVLTSGDPLFFGLGRLLLEQLPAESLCFHPQLSSVQLAFRAIKQPWQDAVILSVHGRSLEVLIAPLKRCPRQVAILTDPIHSPRAIARLLLSLELPVHYRCYVCENLGGSAEKVYQGWPEELLQQEFASLNVLVLVQTEVAIAVEAMPKFGLADSAFATFGDRPGLMTKREVRTLVLAELALGEGQVVWDIGAGTGSVSIEIARLCPQSRVYALEKTAAGVGLIRRNCDRFAVQNVEILRGTAPAALQSLPNPDRIFIGGSGGQLQEILAVCGERLRGGGVIVLAIATLEHLAIAQAWFKQGHWSVRLMQAQFCRGVALAARDAHSPSLQTRWSPLNPVYLLTVQLQD